MATTFFWLAPPITRLSAVPARGNRVVISIDVSGVKAGSLSVGNSEAESVLLLFQGPPAFTRSAAAGGGYRAFWHQRNPPAGSRDRCVLSEYGNLTTPEAALRPPTT